MTTFLKNFYLPFISWHPSSFQPVQFSHLVMSHSLWPHGLQLIRLPCWSPTPRACSNACPLSWWCHPTISSSVVPFSSCLQSFPASGSFPMSWLFTSGGLGRIKDLVKVTERVMKRIWTKICLMSKMPHLSSLLLPGELGPCWVPTLRAPNSPRDLSLALMSHSRKFISSFEFLFISCYKTAYCTAVCSIYIRK